MSNKQSKPPRATEPTEEPAKVAAEAGELEEAEASEKVSASTPDEDMKRKFREAMERKNRPAGAEKSTHGDKGPAGHASSGGPTQRMFRRKAGG